MECFQIPTPDGNCIQLCGSVVCKTPEVIYLRVDPDVWKICCQQYQPKKEVRCPLPKLKSRFRGGPNKKEFTGRGKTYDESEKAKEEKKKAGLNAEEDKKEAKNKEDDKKEGKNKEEEEEKKEDDKKKGESKKEDDKKKNEEKKKSIKKEPEKNKVDSALMPPDQIPDEYCICSDKPKEVCDCEVYKPLNFMLELQVTGEFKPAYVPKAKKGREP